MTENNKKTKNYEAPSLQVISIKGEEVAGTACKSGVTNAAGAGPCTAGGSAPDGSCLVIGS